MSIRQFASEYLSFSKKDRIAILVIVALIIAVFLLPSLLGRNVTATHINTDTAWMAAVKNLEQTDTVNNIYATNRYQDDDNNDYQYDKRVTTYTNSNKGELFYFDPNTLSAEGWAKLGIREKTIHTIQNYLSKGGKFRKPEDVQRIYGLFPNEYERIAPYIQIAEQPGTNNYEYNNVKTEALPAKTYASKYTAVDINVADTTAFIALPGIGSKLAFRIVNFRDKLGGFYSVNQVAETFGLPDSTFQKIKQYLKLDNNAVRKININTATLDLLKAHPYIKYSVANPIIAYRNEHGSFSKIEDIKKVMTVTEEVYNKIAPYLTAQ
jgi:competence protein ComEA